MADQPARQDPAQGEPITSERSKDGLIQEVKPHPSELVINTESWEVIEPGKWRFVVIGGWLEDVIHGLYMEGFHVRQVQDMEGKKVEIVLVEDRWHEISTCPVCGELNTPEYTEEGTRCPDCGATF